MTTKYCVNCEEQITDDIEATTKARGNYADFCSVKCQEEYEQSADASILDQVSKANPDVLPNDSVLSNARGGRLPETLEAITSLLQTSTDKEIQAALASNKANENKPK